MTTTSIQSNYITDVNLTNRKDTAAKVVVAVGICAATGGIFRECYNISGGVDSIIPVDVYVPGCAARPEAIIDGKADGGGAV